MTIAEVEVMAGNPFTLDASPAVAVAAADTSPAGIIPSNIINARMNVKMRGQTAFRCLFLYRK